LADTRTPRPEPITVPCDLNPDLQGHASLSGTLRKTGAGWQFVPSKVLSPVRQPGRGCTEVGAGDGLILGHHRGDPSAEGGGGSSATQRC
jgi:hypothetical protein